MPIIPYGEQPLKPFQLGPSPEVNLEREVAAKKFRNSKYDPQVPKSRKTTPYQMSTRPPKQGTNTKRVVARSANKEKIVRDSSSPTGISRTGGWSKRIMNKKPERSDKKYSRSSDSEAAFYRYEADLKDWNKVNKGVVATPNKKPTAAQKRYTTIQKRRAASLKRSK